MIESGIQIRLTDLIYTLWRRKITILLLTVAGLAFGLLVFAAGRVQGIENSNVTISTSVNLVTIRSDTTFTTGYNVPDKEDYDLSINEAKSAVLMLQYQGTSESVINNLELLGVEPEDIIDHLTVTLQEDTPIIDISLMWSNEKEGKKIVSELVNVLNDLLQENFYVGTAKFVDSINVSDAEYIFGGNSFMIPILTALIGFCLGAGAVILELVLHPTFRNPDDIEDNLGINVLGVVPKVKHPFKEGETILLEDNVAANIRKSYSTIAHILQNMSRKKHGCKTFYVTSAVTGEGCTGAAANLAVHLSYMEHKVLLVDLNFANPQLGSLFLKDVLYENTINAFYHGESTREQITMNLSGYLDLIPAALEMEHISLDKTLLSMLNEFKKDYDYIIIDAEDVHSSTNVLNLRQIADGLIFVILYAGTSVGEIRESLLALNKSGTRIIGAILNQAEEQTTNQNLWRRKSKDRSYGEKVSQEEEDYTSVFDTLEDSWSEGMPSGSILDEEGDMEEISGYSDADMMQALLKDGFSEDTEEGQ